MRARTRGCFTFTAVGDRGTEPEQKTRDESSNSSRVFVEKRRVSFPCGKAVGGLGFHTGSPSGEYS